MLIGVVMMISVSLAYADDSTDKKQPEIGCCLDIWHDEPLTEPHAYWWREKDGYLITYYFDGKKTVIIKKQKMNDDSSLLFDLNQGRKVDI